MPSGSDSPAAAGSPPRPRLRERFKRLILTPTSGQGAHQFIELDGPPTWSKIGPARRPTPAAAAFEHADAGRQPFVVRQFSEPGRAYALRACHAAKPARSFPSSACQSAKPACRVRVVEAILERVSFRELAPHPTRTGAVRDDGRHAAHVGDGMSVGPLAKLLQTGQQLQQRFLIKIVGLFSLARPV